MHSKCIYCGKEIKRFGIQVEEVIPEVYVFCSLECLENYAREGRFPKYPKVLWIDGISIDKKWEEIQRVFEWYEHSARSGWRRCRYCRKRIPDERYDVSVFEENYKTYSFCSFEHLENYCRENRFTKRPEILKNNIEVPKGEMIEK